MVSSDVQEVASERGTNEWCHSNTEVDGAEQRGDVVIDDADQDQHAGDLGSLVDILTFYSMIEKEKLHFHDNFEEKITFGWKMSLTILKILLKKRIEKVNLCLNIHQCLGSKPCSENDSSHRLGREALDELTDDDGDTIDHVNSSEDGEGFGSELVYEDTTEDSCEEVGETHETDQSWGSWLADTKADGSVSEECEDSVDTNIEEEHVDDKQQFWWSLDHRQELWKSYFLFSIVFSSVFNIFVFDCLEERTEW